MPSLRVIRITLLIIILTSVANPIASDSGVKDTKPVGNPDDPIISRIKPSRHGGQAYQLVYRVAVPIEVYWQFKTDFDNSIQTTNKYIRSHRLIKQEDRVAITENRFANAPDVVFVWQTTVTTSDYRLDYILLNPRSCGQKYHYGQIQLKSDDRFTLVVQRIYFDFYGASIWAHFPGPGGMHGFLRYTARWEQKIVLRLKEQYSISGHSPEE